MEGGYTGFAFSRRSVSQSVGPSVHPSPIHVRSITPLLMKGFSSNFNDTFTLTRGCAEPMLPMCHLKVKVTVKGQIFNKQILHIMSCPLYKPYTNDYSLMAINTTIYVYNTFCIYLTLRLLC